MKAMDSPRERDMTLTVECYDTAVTTAGGLVGLGQVRYGGQEDYLIFTAPIAQLRDAARNLVEQVGPEIDFPRMEISIADILEMRSERYNAVEARRSNSEGI